MVREVEEDKEEAESDTAGTTSLIEANLQNSIAVSRFLSRTVSVTGIDTTLLLEPWYREGRSRGLVIPGYSLFCKGGIDLGFVSLGGTRLLRCYQISLAGTW